MSGKSFEYSDFCVLDVKPCLWCEVVRLSRFYFSSKQGGWWAAADSVALQVPSNVSPTVLAEGFLHLNVRGPGDVRIL